MRKVINIGLAAFMLFAIGACGGKEKSGEVKLLESIDSGSDFYFSEYEYDDKNRLVRYVSSDRNSDDKNITTFTYSGNDLAAVTRNNSETKFERKGNVITVVRDGKSVETFTLNEDGFIAEKGSETYQYADGNLIKKIDGDKVTEYKYDDKKSSNYNANTPKWVLQYFSLYLSSPADASKNNVIEVKYDDGTVISYEFQYDSDGFPTSRSFDTEYDNYHTDFTYLNDKATAIPATATEQPAKEQEAKDSSPFVHTLEFNGKKIPITVFHSYETSSEHYTADSLVFEYDGKKHTIKFGKFFFLEPNDFSGHHLTNDDYNFDNYMDIALRTRSFGYGGVDAFDIFLYNPKTKSFHLHEELSGESELQADAKTQTLTSGWGASGEGSLSKFKWINGELTLIYHENKSYENPHKIYTIQTLQNGELVTQTYRMVEAGGIGSPLWMVQNLNDPSKGGKCYEDKPENCEKYGRLYTWEEAMKACPDGWHLPSSEEWQALVDFAGGDEVAGKKLKAKSGWNEPGYGTDEFGFSALPGGGGSGTSFYRVGYDGNWWSSSESSSYNAYLWSMNYSDENADYYNNDKAALYSVRCLRD